MNALKDNGINGQFLSRVSGWLNHPFAGAIAKGAGLNLDKIRSDFSSLQQAANGAAAMEQMAGTVGGGQMSNPAPADSMAADPLARFRQGLQQLK